MFNVFTQEKLNQKSRNFVLFFLEEESLPAKLIQPKRTTSSELLQSVSESNFDFFLAFEMSHNMLQQIT